MEPPADIRLLGLPMPLRWSGPPSPAEIEDATLTMTTGPRTDWLVGPATGKRDASASALLGVAPHDTFTLTARVTVDFTEPLDAGALVVRLSDDHWVKLAFELSPQQRPTVVTVVTQGRSDDAVAMNVDADAVWLKVSRDYGAFAFHASTDGDHWQFIRHFYLGDGDCEIGFLAQSPDGEGARAEFSGVRYINAVTHQLHDAVHPELLEYVVEADLAAPRDQVWRAWTDPAALSGWFGGTPETVRLDVFPGGAWGVGTTDADKGVTPDETLAGRYLDVVDGELLVMETYFVSGDTVMEIRFADHGEGTRVRVHQNCRSEDEREGGREGTKMLLAACDAYVTNMP
jgi:regulation of enolase protein 1 (concanavalin A-like superfamily)/uncharacterized protein YndB with AHSA1/START domain